MKPPEMEMGMKCPDCRKPVLRVDHHGSVTVYVHLIQGKHVYGCAKPKGQGSN